MRQRREKATSPQSDGEKRPQGEKSSRILALVKNLEVLGVLDRKIMRRRVVGGDLAAPAEGVWWKSPGIVGMPSKMNGNPAESPDPGSQLWDFTPK